MISSPSRPDSCSCSAVMKPLQRRKQGSKTSRGKIKTSRSRRFNSQAFSRSTWKRTNSHLPSQAHSTFQTVVQCPIIPIRTPPIGMQLQRWHLKGHQNLISKDRRDTRAARKRKQKVSVMPLGASTWRIWRFSSISEPRCSSSRIISMTQGQVSLQSSRLFSRISDAHQVIQRMVSMVEINNNIFSPLCKAVSII